MCVPLVKVLVDQESEPLRSCGDYLARTIQINLQDCAIPNWPSVGRCASERNGRVLYQCQWRRGHGEGRRHLVHCQGERGRSGSNVVRVSVICCVDRMTSCTQGRYRVSSNTAVAPSGLPKEFKVAGWIRSVICRYGVAVP